MVSPTTSGDEPDGAELFSASRAAAVELSTPPLMAMAMLIAFDSPESGEELKDENRNSQRFSSFDLGISVLPALSLVTCHCTFVMRRHGAQLFHHARQDFECGVNILFRIEAAQAEADAGARLLRFEPDGREHMRGFERPDEHAEPVEQAMPRRSMAITNPSPSIKSNVRFVVVGTRGRGRRSW
jgi:hypothetical protein